MDKTIKKLTGVAWFSLVTVGSTLLIMATSFLVVYSALTWQTCGPRGAAMDAAMQEAQTLRSCSNELIRLTEELAAKRVGATPAEMAAYAQWTSQTYLPKLNDLRKRMREVDAPGAALKTLSDAADKLDAATQAPQAPAQREAATKGALDAAAQAETRIGELRVGAALSETPTLPALNDE